MKEIEEKRAKPDGLGIKGIIVCRKASKGLETALETSMYKNSICIFPFGKRLEI